jgi:hypothetical protein
LKQKKITIIPNVENKVFKNRESFLDYISKKLVFSFKHGRFFLLDKQFKAEEAFAKLSRKLNGSPRQLFLNPAYL